MKQRLANILVYFICALLPWQTVWMIGHAGLPTGETVYGTYVVFALEGLIVLALLLRGTPRFGDRSFVLQPAYFVLATLFFSLTFTAFFRVGVFSILHTMSAAFLFILLCDERTNLKRAILAFVFGLIPPSLLGWFQYLFGFSPSVTWLGLAAKHASTLGDAVIETAEGRSLRAYGSFAHPNIFGGYLAFGILCLGWLVRHTSKRWSYWFSIPIVVLSSTLIITFSRSAWLALCFSLLVFLALSFWKKRLVPHRAIPLITLGLFTLATTIFIFRSHVFARFEPNLRVEAISIEERTTQYGHWFSVWSQNVFIGVGPGAYVFALEHVYPAKASYVYQPIHNTFLLFVSEIGLVGCAALFYLFYQIFLFVKSSLSFSGKLFAIAASVMLLTLGLLDHYLWSLWSGKALVAFMFVCLLRWQTSLKIHS